MVQYLLLLPFIMCNAINENYKIKIKNETN